MEDLEVELRDAILTRALDAIRAINDDELKARCLASLAPHLDQNYVDIAVDLINGISRRKDRVIALVALSDNLEGIERDALLIEAINISTDTGDGQERGELLGLIGQSRHDSTRESIFPQALLAAMDIPEVGKRIEILSGLIPHLTSIHREGAISQVLTSLSQLEDEDFVGAVAKIAPYVTEDLQRNLLVQAYTMTAAIASKRVRANLVAQLIPYLRREQQDESLEVVRDALRDEYDIVAYSVLLFNASLVSTKPGISI